MGFWTNACILFGLVLVHHGLVEVARAIIALARMLERLVAASRDRR